MKWLEALIQWIDDHLNPIVVKELRQAVKGRFIVGVMMIFLVIQLAIMGLYVADYEVRSDFSLGRNLFMTLFGFLVFTGTFIIPAYAGLRMAAERTESEMDLLFITTLTPNRIIRGKFWAALILAGLIYSACMPFLTFTYFLRGIDLPTIFLFLLVGFLGVCLAIQTALFLACIPASNNFKLLLVPFGGSVLLGHLTFTISIVEDLSRRGYGAALWRGERIDEFAAQLVFFAIFFGFWRQLAVAFISPPTTNRSLPVRLYVTASWLAGWLMAWYFSRVHANLSPVEIWLFLSMMTFSFSFFLSVGERDVIGARVACAIPRHPVSRFFAFFFYSGAAGGLAWGAAMIALSTAGAWWLGEVARWGGYSSFERLMETSIGFGLYSYSYALTAVHIRRRLFSDWFSSDYNWVVALLLVSLGSALGPIVGFMMFGPQFDWGYLLNPFVALNETSMRFMAVIFAAVWAGIITLVSFPWLSNQVKNFKPVPEPVPLSESPAHE